MSYKDSFYGAIAEWLRGRGIDASTVTSFEEETVSGGYCETCYYESTEVYIYFEDSNGYPRSYNYFGNMAEFIRELTD